MSALKKIFSSPYSRPHKIHQFQKTESNRIVSCIDCFHSILLIGYEDGSVDAFKLFNETETSIVGASGHNHNHAREAVKFEKSSVYSDQPVRVGTSKEEGKENEPQIIHEHVSDNYSCRLNCLTLTYTKPIGHDHTLQSSLIGRFETYGYPTFLKIAKLTIFECTKNQSCENKSMSKDPKFAKIQNKHMKVKSKSIYLPIIGCQHGDIYLFDIAKNCVIKRFQKVHTSKINQIEQVSEKFLVSASYDKTLVLWEFDKHSLDMQPIRSFRGHSSSIIAFNFFKSPVYSDKFFIISGSVDCQINVYDINQDKIKLGSAPDKFTKTKPEPCLFDPEKSFISSKIEELQESLKPKILPVETIKMPCQILKRQDVSGIILMTIRFGIDKKEFEERKKRYAHFGVDLERPSLDQMEDIRNGKIGRQKVHVGAQGYSKRVILNNLNLDSAFKNDNLSKNPINQPLKQIELFVGTLNGSLIWYKFDNASEKLIKLKIISVIEYAQSKLNPIVIPTEEGEEIDPAISKQKKRKQTQNSLLKNSFAKISILKDDHLLITTIAGHSVLLRTEINYIPSKKSNREIYSGEKDVLAAQKQLASAELIETFIIQAKYLTTNKWQTRMKNGDMKVDVSVVVRDFPFLKCEGHNSDSGKAGSGHGHNKNQDGSGTRDDDQKSTLVAVISKSQINLFLDTDILTHRTNTKSLWPISQSVVFPDLPSSGEKGEIQGVKVELGERHIYNVVFVKTISKDYLLAVCKDGLYTLECRVAGNVLVSFVVIIIIMDYENF